MYRAIAAGVMTVLALHAQPYTRGVGVYPGAPEEYAGPLLRPDGSYRNVALHRPAYHSSSYDYNLTAQLITDGIKDTKLPRWVATSTSRAGELARNQREWLLDGNWVTSVALMGRSGWVQVELGGGESPLTIDRIEADGRVLADPGPENWSLAVLGSDDGKSWRQLGSRSEMARTGGDIRTSVGFASPSQSRFYRLEFSDPRARGFEIGEVRFFHGGSQVHVGGPYDFTSAWMPGGAGEEWVYVDLGALCTFDRVRLSWIRRPASAVTRRSASR